ncbi:hypothetical protein M422DRAFT_23700 [Sphaerobolus stellatus SS14]|nr:hypothetical protein M422DRAFT_23700 [Sphaerobolus stellatus SS14]
MKQFLSGHPEQQEIASSLGNKGSLFQGLAIALERGNRTPYRPGLPVKLVIYIMRLADCTSVNRRLTTSVDTPCRIKADDSKAIQKLWFETPTLTIGEISNMARIQLHTVSRDQGWCSNPQDGSWSWFEIVVLTPLREDPTQFVVKKGSGSHLNDGELIWISHHNPIASDAARHRPGIVFTGDHEIFTHLQEGDKIGVRICAQFGNWQNFALEGALRIDQWFDPTRSN